LSQTQAKSVSTKVTSKMENWKGITVKFSTFRKRPNMLAVSRAEKRADMASTTMEMVEFGKDSGKITGKMAMVS
jgi:hypothetical protein